MILHYKLENFEDNDECLPSEYVVFATHPDKSIVDCEEEGYKLYSSHELLDNGTGNRLPLNTRLTPGL